MNPRYFHVISVLALTVLSGCRHTTALSQNAGLEQRVAMSKLSVKAGRYDVSITNRGTTSIYYLYEAQMQHYDGDRPANFGAAPTDVVHTSKSSALIPFPKFFTRMPKELKPGGVAVFTGYTPKHISAPSNSNRWSIRFQWQDSVDTDSFHEVESAKVDF